MILRPYNIQEKPTSARSRRTEYLEKVESSAYPGVAISCCFPSSAKKVKHKYYSCLVRHIQSSSFYLLQWLSIALWRAMQRTRDKVTTSLERQTFQTWKIVAPPLDNKYSSRGTRSFLGWIKRHPPQHEVDIYTARRVGEKTYFLPNVSKRKAYSKAVSRIPS